MSENLKTIYLNDFYNLQGAKLASFSGYSMPINFSKGIIKEHLHTRSAVGIFDVSHMGQMFISCTDTNINKLELIIPHNLRKLKLFKSVYTFILNKKGGIVDDLIISKVKIDNLEYFFLVYNASRKIIDQKIICNIISDAKIVLDNSILAIQGPLSQNIINHLFPETVDIKFLQIKIINYMNEYILISRSGYTGEDGFEIYIPNTLIANFIEKILSYEETLLCGLGSRDSLRLEAGLCLYGNELNEYISPIQANLEWAIPRSRIEQGRFNGHERILNEINNGVDKKRVGIKLKSRSILRSNMTLYNKKNYKIGKITSGGFSPSLNTSIGMAYINTNIINESEEVKCLIRNNMEEVEIIKLPFVQHNYKRG